MESSYVMSGVVAAQAKCASNGELKNLVDTGSRKVTGVPRLDEKQLEMKLPEVSAMAPPFIVSDMSAAAAEGPAAPLNLNPPVYVLGPSSPYNAAGVYAVDSPSASPAFVALMQQQAFQYQQMQQAVATEQEAAFVNKLIQQCSRPVLLMTLTSLLEEFPLLSTVIRQRCEKAMVIVSNQQQQQQNQHQQQQPQQQNQQQQQQQQQQKLHHQQHQNQNQQPQHPQQVAAASAVVGRFGPHGQDMVQWAGHAGNNNYESPRASSFACGNNTPQSTGARKGRGSKSREEGLCSCTIMCAQ
uniref:Uncharacterized protein n=1 Tax=Trypanosoma vivax (strain Y486) TaxID=1055687 RepID=G0U542_TRYVY|nr:conserved hypothetical protein [Trypanosoma vivax Y486]